jgi:hypothetical protein
MLCIALRRRLYPDLLSVLSALANLPVTEPHPGKQGTTAMQQFVVVIESVNCRVPEEIRG